MWIFEPVMLVTINDSVVFGAIGITYSALILAITTLYRDNKSLQEEQKFFIKESIGSFQAVTLALNEQTLALSRLLEASFEIETSA